MMCAVNELSLHIARKPYLITIFCCMRRSWNGSEEMETDYGRILVLGEGTVSEYDSPVALFAESDGAFRRMCEHTGDGEEL
jgi:hypothetical protein